MRVAIHLEADLSLIHVAAPTQIPVAMPAAAAVLPPAAILPPAAVPLPAAVPHPAAGPLLPPAPLPPVITNVADNDTEDSDDNDDGSDTIIARQPTQTITERVTELEEQTAWLHKRLEDEAARNKNLLDRIEALEAGTKAANPS
jgi:hypothetical protein